MPPKPKTQKTKEKQPTTEAKEAPEFWDSLFDKKKIAAENKDLSPLDVMLETMRFFYGTNNLPAACSIARDAAPYCHNRLTSTEFAATDPLNPDKKSKVTGIEIKFVEAAHVEREEPKTLN